MFIRYGTAIAAGCVVTISLLWLMQSLIHLTGGEDTTPRTRHELAFLPVIDEKPVVPEDLIRKYEELKETVEAMPQQPSDPGFDGQGITVLTGAAPEPILSGETIGVSPDGPLVTMVRVRPVYPIRATEKNLDGYVIVEFDVNADGTVSNVRVIESSHRIFEKSSISAAERFRYKPRVVDGVALPSTGIRNVFRFEMERT